jgi:diguanylate cyclase (GGDEF)-like protein
MSKWQFGLRAKFLLVTGTTLVAVAAIMGTLLVRQASMQQEARQLSSKIIHDLFERSARSRGEHLAVGLGEALVNPMYYADLDAVGALVRNTVGQEMVRYVWVFDAQGGLVHDGSVGMDDYGRPMADPLATKALATRVLLSQLSADTLDVTAPILIGDDYLGGVRVGLSLDKARQNEGRASAELDELLASEGRRYLGWLAALLAAMGAFGVGLAVYVQRTLVQPIRGLAVAARRIESGDYTVQKSESLRRDEVGELLNAFSRMSESIARHDREVRHIAYTDALTGLTNRRAFREALDVHIDAARAAGRQLSLLFADIDDFKRVNDTSGHEAGDEALLQFTQRFGIAVEQLGGDDVLLARFGGDEFVILVGGDEAATTATALAERLVADSARQLQVNGREIFLGASIGIATFPDDAGDATALLKNGDIAMYQAKFAGKSCYRHYSRAMDHAVERRMHMEQELRGAWERGELRLVYQPIFRMANRHVVGVEVLLRWDHPLLGAVPPAVFIDVAEQSGLIETIGPQVLLAACQEASRWPLSAEGEPMFISVNVSSKQLRSGDLAEVVAQCLHDTGLSPACLHLELTETAVIGDEVSAAALLEKLHRMGVKVWLDDFGTGFSGLSHLRQVPVDGVKIDKSFVADLHRDGDDLALTSAIIAMAHALDITVVAEGIEQEVQFNLLSDRHCDLAQGYWLSQPLSLTSLLKLMKADAA